MICSVVYRFRAIPFSPQSRLEIAGFAHSAWHHFRGAGQTMSPPVHDADVSAKPDGRSRLSVRPAGRISGRFKDARGAEGSNVVRPGGSEVETLSEPSPDS